MVQKKTKLVLILLVIIILAVLVPQHQANAGLFDFAISEIAEKIGSFILGLVGQAVSWFAQAFDAFIRYQTDSGVYNIVIVDQSWTIIRNFVNMLFILVLIITAFGTIFDIQRYVWKDVLPKFIIAALLINFSLAIGQYIITISNGLASVFLEQIAASGSLSERLAQGFSPGNVPTATTGAGGIVIAGVDAMFSTATTLIFGIVWLIIMLIVFLSLFIFAIARLLALWFLLIISPIAWFGYALPNLRANMWNTWWKHFLCWCFFLPYYLFFLMFAIIFINSKDSIPGVSSTASVALGTMTINNMLFYGVTLVLLIYGLAMAKKMACASGTYVGAAFGKIEAGVRKYAPGAAYVRGGVAGLKERGAEIVEKGVKVPFTGGYRLGGTQKGRLEEAAGKGFVAGVPGPGQVPGAREARGRAEMVEIEKDVKRIREQLLRLPADQQKAFLEAEKSKKNVAGQAATLEYAAQGHSSFKQYQELAQQYGGENSAFMRQYRENVGKARWSDLFRGPDQQLDMARGQIEGSENLKELRRELFKDLATRNRIKNIDDYNMAKNLWSEVPLELKRFTESIKPEYMFIDKQKRQDAIRDFDPNNKKTGDRELMEKLAEFMKDKKEINSWDLRNKVLSIVGSDTLAGSNIINEINKFNPTVNIEAEFRSTRSGDLNAPLSENDNNEIVDRLAEKLGTIDFPEIRKMHGDFWKNVLSAKAVEKMVGDNAETFSQLMRDAPGQMRVAMKDLQEKMEKMRAQKP